MAKRPSSDYSLEARVLDLETRCSVLSGMVMTLLMRLGVNAVVADHELDRILDNGRMPVRNDRTAALTDQWMDFVREGMVRMRAGLE